MVEIKKLFDSNSESVYHFFSPQVEAGYYIPSYQRKYTWDKENVDQLMDDICSGVFQLIDPEESGGDTIHFLGTIILVKPKEFKKTVDSDKKALPRQLYNVIDGQQRISTISLIATCLYKKIDAIASKLPSEFHDVHPVDLFKDLREIKDHYLEKLERIFSFDLERRGDPSKKPIIIRESEDRWTLDGKDEENYHSPVSSYLAKVIRALDTNNKQNILDFTNNTLINKNVKRIRAVLEDIGDPHVNSSFFPSALKIIKSLDEDDLRLDQDDLFFYEVDNLIEYLDSEEYSDQFKNNVASLVQILTFTYFLLERCCLTRIQPLSEIRAFDMFQSLNATGTPLTALETFKPVVVNDVKNNNEPYKDSTVEWYFEQIDELMNDLSSASRTKSTNEYLRLFSTAYGKEKLGTQFSIQRKWLIDTYQNIEDFGCRKRFIHAMGDVAVYCREIVYSKVSIRDDLPRLESTDKEDKQVASLCLQYLKDAKHRMAHTLLSLFYSFVLRNASNSHQNFVDACKATAAFYTLWRSALNNQGLDDSYRGFFQDEISFNPKQYSNLIDSNKLKIYFRNQLEKSGIGNYEDWKKKSVEHFRYNKAQAVCKFALFMTAEDTIADPDYPGLMKSGVKGSKPGYLRYKQWVDVLKTIEHIAPKKVGKDSSWDSKLYENEDYEKIGNLTLLPVQINSSLGNKDFQGKLFYYKYLAETDPSQRDSILAEASSQGMQIRTKTREIFDATACKHHIAPIITVEGKREWDQDLVNERTKRICEILWKKLYDDWLQID